MKYTEDEQLEESLGPLNMATHRCAHTHMHTRIAGSAQTWALVTLCVEWISTS